MHKALASAFAASSPALMVARSRHCQRAAAARFPPTTSPPTSLPSLRQPLQAQRPWQTSRLVLRPLTVATASAAAASPAPSVEQRTPSLLRSPAFKLAIETLRPDWPLLLGTSVSLAATIAFTLMFPLAMGAVFDVVRAQGGLTSAAAGPAAAAINPFSHAAAAAAPSSFQGALLKLAACLVLSATGNALVAYLSTIAGERFGHRLKGRLMQVRPLARSAWPEIKAVVHAGCSVARLALCPPLRNLPHGCVFSSTPDSPTNRLPRCCLRADHHGAGAVLL